MRKGIVIVSGEEGQRVEHTDYVVYSYDKDSFKFVFYFPELERLANQQALLVIVGETLPRQRYDLTINDGKAEWMVPEALLGYEGHVKGYLHTSVNGQPLSDEDFMFTFSMKRSENDKDVYQLQNTYYDLFDDAVEQIKLKAENTQLRIQTMYADAIETISATQDKIRSTDGTIDQELQEIYDDLRRYYSKSKSTMDREVVKVVDRKVTAKSEIEQIIEELRDLADVGVYSKVYVDDLETSLKNADTLLTRAIEFLNTDVDNLESNLTETNLELTSTKDEINAARGGAQTLGERLDEDKAEVTAQLAQTAQALDYYWQPELQLSARSDEPPYFANGFVGTADGYIDELFEPLRTSFPEYATRDIVSKDQSGLFNIYRYFFTPKRYKKTIIIQTCLHGSEIAPMLAMSRILKHLCENWKMSPRFAEIRKNVRIIYIPFANPWGTSQVPRTRQNSSGVDINRNFDYMFESYTSQANTPFGHDYKGTAPNSEAETLAVLKTISDYPDAMAFLDLHSTGAPSRDIYIALPNAYDYDVYDNIIDYFTRDIANPDVLLQRNHNPNIANYLYTNYQSMPVSIPEWCDKRYGGNQYSSTDLTKAVEWFGNVIIEHTRALTGKERVRVISDEVITNFISNGNFSSGSDGWSLQGTIGTSVEGGVLSSNGSAASSTPFIRETLASNYVKGTKVYARASFFPPEGCKKVEIRFRDNTSPGWDPAWTIVSVEDPTPNQWVDVSGLLEIPETINNLSVQLVVHLYDVGKPFKIKNIVAVKLPNVFATLSEREIDQMIKNSGQDYFTDLTIQKFILNSNLLERHERELWSALG